MKFIREMIARKAAGEDQARKDFGIEGFEGLPNENPDQAPMAAGFEDELAENQPVVDDANLENHANDDAVAESTLDEEAELDALDAEFPDIEPAVDETPDDSEETAEMEVQSAQDPVLTEEAPMEQPNDTEAEQAEESVVILEEPIVPQPIGEGSVQDAFADVQDVNENEDPMPELTAEDIQRAMKNRKKIWHALPDEDDDPLALLPEDEDNMVTRPIRRTSQGAIRQVSVPLELVSDNSSAMGEEVEPPAMEAPEPLLQSVDDQPELTSMMPAVEPEEDIEASADQLDEISTDEMPEDEAASLEPVVDEATADEPSWPLTQPDEPETAQAEEPAAAPTIPQMDSPDIQALMARAALEAAGDTSPRPEDTAADAAPAKPNRRAGRVKTRLLGFQPESAEKNIFETAGAAKSSQPDMFPVGWIVVQEGPGRGAGFSLHTGVSLIGRGEDQAVCLDFGDNSISRDNHASIAFDDESGQFFFGHGGKSNIVRLNGKPVLSTEELSHGDTIKIGETTLRFQALCGADFSWKETEGGEAGNASIA